MDRVNPEVVLFQLKEMKQHETRDSHRFGVFIENGEAFWELTDNIIYLLRKASRHLISERPIEDGCLYRCPTCRMRIQSLQEYCDNCGQQIKWKE